MTYSVSRLAEVANTAQASHVSMILNVFRAANGSCCVKPAGLQTMTMLCCTARPVIYIDRHVQHQIFACLSKVDGVRIQLCHGLDGASDG